MQRLVGLDFAAVVVVEGVTLDVGHVAFDVPQAIVAPETVERIAAAVQAFARLGV